MWYVGRKRDGNAILKLTTLGLALVSISLCSCSVQINRLDQAAGDLSLTPGTSTLGIGNQKRFVATGGTPPYSYELLTGSGVLDSRSGLFTAPASPGAATLLARDAAGMTASASVNVVNLPSFSWNTSLLTGESAALGATDGVPPLSYSDSGTGFIDPVTGAYSVPLTLDAPTVDTLRVTDSLGNTSTKTVSLRVFQTKSNYQATSTGKLRSIYAYKTTRAPNGDLYSVGESEDANSITHWTVSKSTDGGSTWSAVDTYLLHAPQYSYATNVATDTAGSIYVIGSARDAALAYHWVVRKSTDAGATWSTVSDYQLISNSNSMATAIHSTSGAIYVGGYGTDGTADHWIIRKSTNGGVTWSTVSDYFLIAGKGARVNALGKDSAGNLYAGGYTTDTNNIRHWIVRKSADGGSNWTTVDDYQFDANYNSNILALTGDSAGNLYVAGTGGDLTTTHWIVRKSTDGGATWSTVSDYLHGGGVESSPFSIVSDSTNTVYVAGYGFASGAYN